MELSLKNYYLRWIRNLSLLFLFLLTLMTLLRLGFMFQFDDWSRVVKEKDFFRSLWLGVRFDLIPLCYLFAPSFILIHLSYFLPGKKTIRFTRAISQIILKLGVILIVGIYLFDYGFYSYFQDHMNILIFGFLEDDTFALLTSIWKNYNVPLWSILLMSVLFVFFRLIEFTLSPFDFDLKPMKKKTIVFGSFFVGLIALALGGRGTFHRLPLSLEDAHIGQDEFLNKASLNGFITLNRALKIRKTFGKGSVDYLASYGFKNWQEAATALGAPSERDLSAVFQTKTNLLPTPSQPHVILVVMESFGTYWLNYHSSSFNLLGSLEEHFKKEILFKNFLPAENGTIGSIVSIATSQVIRPGARFLSESEFMNQKMASAGHLPFKEEGYETHFVYGGKLGWRDLGKFLKQQDYDHLWGAQEMKDYLPELSSVPEKDLGNEWGIFDEYLFQFIEEKLKLATKPQLFLVLTTSNHPPFEVPSHYEPFPLGLTDHLLQQMTVDSSMARLRFRGLQYANHQLGTFISRMKKSTNPPVIAMTGDHSFWIAKGLSAEDEFKRYAVPFFISLPPSLKREMDTTKFGSHEDIFPTLYDIVFSQKKVFVMGDSLLTKDEPSAQNSSGLIANRKGAFHKGQSWDWLNFEKQKLKPSNDPQAHIRLKEYQEALISLTDLWLKNEKKNKPLDAKNDPQ